MSGLELLSSILPFGMAAILPAWLAFSAYRGVSRAARIGSWVRLAAAGVFGIGVESARRAAGVSYVEAAEFAFDGAVWAFDALGGLDAVPI